MILQQDNLFKKKYKTIFFCRDEFEKKKENSNFNYENIVEDFEKILFKK